MKVKVTKPFIDKNTNLRVEAETIIDVSIPRANELIKAGGYIELIETKARAGKKTDADKPADPDAENLDTVTEGSETENNAETADTDKKE